MNEEKIWDAVKHQIINEDGGTLRDIYVQNTDIGGWRNLLASIESEGYDYSAEQNGEAVSIKNFDPFSHLLNPNSDLNPHLYLKRRNLQFNCHFFWHKEIEFDIDPKEIKDISDAIVIFEFMRMASNSTKKDCILTYENVPEIKILQFSISTGQFEIGNGK